MQEPGFVYALNPASSPGGLEPRKTRPALPLFACRPLRRPGRGFLPALVLLFLAASVSAATAAPAGLRVYFIGNSVTDTVRYEGLAKLAEARGLRLDWGRTMIPGAPLAWIYLHPDSGLEQAPYGRWSRALNEFVWDAVSLQPFDRHLRGDVKDGEDFGDVAVITKLARLAAAKNPDVQVYLYARWPRVTVGGKDVPFDKNDYDPTKPGSGNDLSRVDDYLARWEMKYTGAWDGSNESRDYFDTLLREVRREAAFLRKPPLLVPVGHVLADLHRQMKAGALPGWTDVRQFYKDGIHLNEPGSYAVACTYFATLFRESPVGLPSEPYGQIAPDLARVIQETAWRVVSTHPESGVPVAGASAAKPLRPLPYPPSRVLSGLTWTTEPHRYPGIHSDMHWQTWGADDAIYSVDGDGSYPGVKDYYGSLARITGTPLDHRIELVTQFRELRICEERTPEGMRRYFCGPLAVGTNLYVCLYDYDWRILGRNVTNREDFLVVDRYSKLGGIPGIMLSRDGGQTWSNVPDKDTPRFLGPNFGNLQFIGFGPGYTRVPPEYGDYVYAVSNDSNWESGDHLYLARVHRDRVLERGAWEFFAGTAESPEWTKDEASAKPVFRDPGHVGHSDMTYVPALKRFLLAVFSDTVPHREDATYEETQTWEKHTELQLYEGPTPWGPWGLVYREEPWGGPDHACYLPHIPAKWLDADGLGGWMLYSGDWEMTHYPGQPYYGYMTRRFRLEATQP